MNTTSDAKLLDDSNRNHHVLKELSTNEMSCNGNGFCLFKRNPKMHIIWSAILGSVIIVTIIFIIIQHRRKRRRSRPQKAYIYDLRLSEPLPRYSPAHNDCQPLTHEDVYRMHSEMFDIRKPVAAALKPQASCSPPPYIGSAPNIGTDATKPVYMNYK